MQQSTPTSLPATPQLPPRVVSFITQMMTQMMTIDHKFFSMVFESTIPFFILLLSLLISGTQIRILISLSGSNCDSPLTTIPAVLALIFSATSSIFIVIVLVAFAYRRCLKLPNDEEV